LGAEAEEACLRVEQTGERLRRLGVEDGTAEGEQSDGFGAGIFGNLSKAESFAGTRLRRLRGFFRRELETSGPDGLDGWCGERSLEGGADRDDPSVRGFAILVRQAAGLRSSRGSTGESERKLNTTDSANHGYALF